MCLINGLSMLTCLAAAIAGTDRVISAEEGYVLRLRARGPGVHADESGLEARWRETAAPAGESSPANASVARLVIGEVRAEKCLDRLLALNARLSRGATCVDSAREALAKNQCTMPLVAATTGRR